jgi:biotin operon repressor
MQYQNENTIRELVSIARGQVKTLMAICDRIDLELNKPAIQPQNVVSEETVQLTRKRLTAKQQETFNCLKGRTKPVSIKTICRDLNIPEATAYWRISSLRKAGVDVVTHHKGKPVAKYKLA